MDKDKVAAAIEAFRQVRAAQDPDVDTALVLLSQLTAALTDEEFEEYLNQALDDLNKRRP